jgi:hypothetical protein
MPSCEGIAWLILANNRRISMQTKEADVSLIAAAPDLLAALEELSNPSNFRTDPTIDTLRFRDKAIAKARAAIAKARGEA